MVRLVALGMAVPLVWLTLGWVIRLLRSRNVDWSGVAFAAGFVVLAFYLRHATGLG